MAKRSKGERQSSVPATDTPDVAADLAPAQTGSSDADASGADASGADALQAASVTREFPAASLEAPEQGATASAPADSVDVVADDDVDNDEGATREAAIVPAPRPIAPDVRPNETIILAMPIEPASELPEHGEPQPPETPAVNDSSQDTPTPRQRFNTLAGAFSRPRPDTPPEEYEPAPSFLTDEGDAGIVDEVDPEVEWSVADQPTIQLTQEELGQLRPSSFLDTGEFESWPPRPNTTPPPARSFAPPPPPTPPARPEEPRERFDWRSSLPPRPQPPFPLSNLGSPLANTERLAAPDGRPAMPIDSDGPAPDYRMERFQELRRHRMAHDQGDPATDDVTPVADAVRQWWRDLRPGVGGALKYQREARESGTHPLPAYAPAPATSKLGDAFGRLAASARGMTERAQHVAGPRLKSLHDHVEQAAQGLMKVIEGDATRQQAPLLGPGRVAIFFRKGVSVGQAQRLLAASSARPMRLIPRKHGILAQVMPGTESEIGERLRQHPYVNDVAYMAYDGRSVQRER